MLALMVALASAAWQSGRMATSPSRTPMAGGFLLSSCILVGAIAGAMKGQASLGFVIGTGAGIALALLIWLIDRMRR